MRIELAGPPVPKGRPRLNRKTGTIYTPKETRVYEQSLAYLFLAKREKFFDEELVFSAWFYTKNKRADCDNYLKAAMDSAIGIAFTDDKQVVEIHAYKIISEEEKTIIEIEAAGHPTAA